MNKKLIAILMAVLMVIFAGCGSGDDSETETSDSTSTTDEQGNVVGEETSGEAVPGVVEVEDAVVNPFIEDEENTANGTENNEGTSPNSQSGANGTTSTSPSGTTGTTGSDDDSGNGTSQGGATTEPTTPPTTESTTPPTTQPNDNIDYVSYEEYNAMTPEEQEAYFEQFESVADFVAWYQAAKAEYEEQNPDIDVGDGSIDIGEIIGGKS